MIHCSATPADQSLKPEKLSDMHAERGINRPGGYHVYITRDGKKHYLRDFDKTGAHCRGRNRDTIGICYEGGIVAGGNPNKASDAVDTRTTEQKRSLAEVIIEVVRWNCKNGHTEIEIGGHRDESPDIDGDGIVEPWEWLKQCPCFDVKPEYETLVRVAQQSTDPGQMPKDPRE